jgi:hypothetical protein
MNLKTIKYRAISLDTNKWVFGYGLMYSQDFNEANIIHKQGNNLMNNTAVNPETICMFTGFYDKHGKEIYFSIGGKGADYIYDYNKPMKVSFGLANLGSDNFIVEYNAVCFHVVFHDGGRYALTQDAEGYSIKASKTEIVGNDIDNPKLLDFIRVNS